MSVDRSHQSLRVAVDAIHRINDISVREKNTRAKYEQVAKDINGVIDASIRAQLQSVSSQAVVPRLSQMMEDLKARLQIMEKQRKRRDDMEKSVLQDLEYYTTNKVMKMLAQRKDLSIEWTKKVTKRLEEIETQTMASRTRIQKKVEKVTANADNALREANKIDKKSVETIKSIQSTSNRFLDDMKKLVEEFKKEKKTADVKKIHEMEEELMQTREKLLYADNKVRDMVAEKESIEDKVSLKEKAVSLKEKTLSRSANKYMATNTKLLADIKKLQKEVSALKVELNTKQYHSNHKLIFPDWQV